MKIDKLSVGITDYCDVDQPTTWYTMKEFADDYGYEEDSKTRKQAVKIAKSLNDSLTDKQIKSLSKLLTFVWECGRTNGYNSF